MAKKKERYIVGLDIGTHKVCAIVAEVTEEGRLDVIGIGQAESKGLRKGVVINLEATVDSIKRVVEVHWLRELGIAQALWVLEVERLGPFLVEGDRAGRSLFALANREINARLREVYRELPPFSMGRFGEQTSCEEEIV